MKDAVIVSVDFRALRQGGLLSLFGSSRVAQEPEYRAFVDKTGFDYLSDLDSALISFHPTGTCFLLRGRFDWRALKDYVTGQGGSCHNTLCLVSGSTPDRNISFFPMRSNVMALAVSGDTYAATQMQASPHPLSFDPPEQPIWSHIPLSALNSPNLPPGTRMFARALAGTGPLLLSAGLSGSGLSVTIEATCPNEAAARALTEQLRAATAQLQTLIALEHQTPNPGDLSGVLVAGAFESRERRVIGRWPLDRAFLANLAGGSL